MPRLKWDEAGKRNYETGVSHGVVYPQDNKGEYPKGAAWNGLTGVTQSPDGAEPTDLYANNGKYLTLRSAENFKFNIEAYTYPSEFEACDGCGTLADGVTVGQQDRQPFGFTYRTEIGNDTGSSGDDGYKLHLVYGATASPSEKAYQTINDNPEAITFSWDCSTVPVDISGFKPAAHIEIDSTKVDKEKLKQLEDMLYGTETEDAHLPLPDEVIAIFTGKPSSTEDGTEG
jgi:hypothetical protein